MAPTKSGGRVSIRVFPDTTRFRSTLKKHLDEIERTTEVRIKVTPEVDRRSIVKMKGQIEAHLEDTTFQIRAEVEVTQASLRKVRAEIEQIRATVNVNVRTVAAQAQLAALTRSRNLEIMPFLNTVALANVSRRLAGLGGLGVLSDTLRDARTFLDNIDRQAVAMGRFALNVMSIVSALGSLTAMSLTVANDLGSLVGILTLLPALGIGLGITIGSLVAVLKDMNEVLADLGPSFGELQDVMSANFWAEAADPIRELVNNILPTLRTELGELSTVQGKFLADIANSIRNNVTPNILATMMDRLTAATDRARGAIDPFIQAITTLGLHGTEYFDRMAVSLVEMSERFNDFIQRADRDGSLDRWTEDAIRGFKDLFGIVEGSVRIIYELGMAAEAAGFGGLSDLNTALNSAADAMGREEFQRPLIEYFRGFREGIFDIGRGLGELGVGLGSFAPVFREAARSAGASARVILGYVSDLLQNPEFQTGVIDFFEGIERGVRNMGPGMDVLNKSLGDTLSLLGVVAGELGNLISTFLVEFGPGFDIIAQELESLVPALSNTAREVIENLSPAFTNFAENVLPKVTSLFKTEMLPAIEDISAYIGEGLIPAFEELEAFVDGELRTAIEGIGDWLDEADPPETFGDNVRRFFDDVTDFLNKSRGEDGGLMEGDWLGLESGSSRESMNNFMTDITNFNNDVAARLREGWNNVVVPAWDEIIRINNEKLAELQEDPEIPGQWLLDFFARIFEPIGAAIAEDWEEINANWDKHWNDFGAGLQGMGEDFIYWLETPLRDMRAYWDRFFDDLFGRESDSQAKMVSFPAMASAALAPLAESITANLPFVQATWDLFWTSLGTTITNKFTEYGLAVGVGMMQLSTSINLTTTGVRATWDIFWTGLGTTIQAKFLEYGVTVTTGMMGLSNSINISTSIVKSTWDIFWAGLGLTVQTKFMEYGTTVATGMMGLSNSIVTNSASIKANWDTTWSVMDQVLRGKFSQYVITTSTGMMGIYSDITTKMGMVQSNWSTTWEVIRGIAAQKWSQISSAVQIGTQNAAQFVSAMGPTVQSYASTAWTLVQGATQVGWSNVTSAVSIGVQLASNEAGTFGSRAASAVGDLGGILVSSGQSLVQGFIDGIGSMMNSLETAAAGIAATISKYMPRSPAKKGPLSGKGYTSWSGKALVRDMALGMESEIGLVKAAAAKVASGAGIDAKDLTSPNSAFESSMERYGGDSFRFDGPVFGSIPELVETVKRTRRRELVVQRVQRLAVG